MQIPHNALVLVADGRKLLFLRNEGDAEFPNLTVEMAEEHPNAKNSDQATDAAGRASSSHSGAGAPAGARGGSNGGGGQGGGFAPARGSLGNTDFHQLEEDRFAAEAGEMLKKRALSHKFEALIVVAPPRTLGELRKHYHKEVEHRLVGEVGKDLTGHSVPDIEAALQAA